MASDPNAVDPAEAFLQQRRQNMRAVAVSQQDLALGPDEAAQTWRAGEAQGVPPAIALRTAPDVAAEAERRRLDALGQSSPATATWLRVKPERLAIARDDLENLSALETWLGVRAPGRGTAIGRGLERYTDTLYRAPAAGFAGYFGQALSGTGELIDSGARAMDRGFRAVAGDAAADALWFEGPWWANPAELARRPGDAIASGVDSFDVPDARRNFLTDVTGGVGQLGGMTLQGLYAPQTLVPSLLGVGAEQQATRAQEAGQYGTAAADAAVLVGAPATAALERFGLSKILDRVPPRIKNDLMRGLVDKGLAFGWEAGQEVTEQLAQDAITAATFNPEQRIGEGLAYQGTVAGTSATVVRTLLGVRSPLRPVVESTEDTARIDQLHTLGAALKVSGRAPAEAEDLVREIIARAPQAPRQVYVDAQALAIHYRSQRLDPVAEIEALTGDPQAFVAAATAGTDLVVPIERYIVHATRSPQAEAIKRLTRLEPDRYTAADLDALNVEELLTTAPAAQVDATTRTETEDTLREQLLAAKIAPAEAASRAKGLADRIIAAEDQVTASESEDGLAGMDLGTERAALGITDAQWAAYQVDLETARDQARTNVTERLMAAETRQRDRWYAEEAAAVRAKVEDELDLPRTTRAWQILAGRAEVGGEPVAPELRGLKLDRAALVAAHGEAWVTTNLKSLGVYRKDGGQNPDAVAVALGFPSGDAMVKALAGVKGAQVRVAAEVEKRMRARAPDPLFDGSLPDIARDALHNDARFRALDTELGLLAQLANQPRPDVAALRAMATERIGQIKIANLTPHLYLAAERRAARQATQAAAGKRWGAAVVAKRQQALNAALYAQARTTLAQVEIQERYARSFDKPAARQRVGKAGGDLLETMDEILAAYSFRNVSDVKRERVGFLRRWYDRMEANGITPDVPADVMRQIDESRRVHFRELTPDQLGGVVKALQQIEHQATEALQLRLAGETLQLEQAAETLAGQIRTGLKDRGPPPASEILRKSGLQKGKRALRMAAAILTRLRAFAGHIDGDGNVEGPFHRMVIRPLDRAQADYLDEMAHYGQKVVALFDQHMKGQDLTKPIWIPSIGQNLAKGDILAVALNMGNAGNLQRLRDGRGWGDVQLMDMMQHMEKRDWDFAQGVWDTLETLWPKIAAQQKRLTGVEPGRVRARPIKTPFGEYRGGYYPVVYDQESPAWREFARGEEDSWFDQAGMMALPPNGHTLERVVKARIPIKIDLGVIPQHLSRIVKDLTHRETVIGIRRLMRQHDVLQALTETAGPEFHSMIEDKLKQVATDQVIEAARSMDGMRKVSAAVRRHVGVMAMGLNVVTGLKQILGLAGAGEVMVARHGRAGPRLLLQGYHRLLQGWGGTVDAVAALSGEMRHRQTNMDADIRLVMDRYLSGTMQPGLKGKAARAIDGSRVHAHVLIRYAQHYLVDLPLWLAAHEGALRKGASADAARAAADDAVITSQGAGGAKDTALIEGNIPGVELFTMFYSYASAFLNRQVSLGRDLGKSMAGGPGRLAAELPLLSARASLLLVLPVLLEDLIGQAIGASEGPDEEDESWVSYYAMKVLAYQFYGLPLARDLTSSYGYRATPAQSVGDSFRRLAATMSKALGGEEVEARKAARDAVNAVGYTLGLPLAGPWKHIDYLWRVYEGEEEPETVPEFAAATLAGKREER